MEENTQQQNPQENNPAENKPENAEQSGQPEQQQQEQGGEGQAADAKDVEENKALTYLAYLGLLFLVPLFAKKESKFAQFHAKQGLVLTIAWFLGSFLVPIFGLGMLVYIAVLVLSIMGLINVSKGEMKDLPLVGDIAKKFNF
jgi:uncharacterized membrane protein